MMTLDQMKVLEQEEQAAVVQQHDESQLPSFSGGNCSGRQMVQRVSRKIDQNQVVSGGKI